VLGGRPDQRDHAFFDVRQERILLRLVEAMDLVAEEDRAAPFGGEALLRFTDDLAHARHAFGHGAEDHEGLVGVVRDEPGEGRLAAARRAPQHHAPHLAALDRLAQRLARAEQVLLAEELVQGLRPQEVGERRLGGGGARGGLLYRQGRATRAFGEGSIVTRRRCRLPGAAAGGPTRGPTAPSPRRVATGAMRARWAATGFVPAGRGAGYTWGL